VSRIRQATKIAIQEVLGRLGVLEAGEKLILDVRRALTPLGKSIYEEGEKRFRFYSRFVKSDDLCFDVGANYGNRVEAFLRLGARVVAVEPQDDVMHYLFLKYRRESRVTLIHAGLDNSEGERIMYVCETTRGASSMCQELVEVQKMKHPTLQYKDILKVPVTTMDRLVEIYGVPDFCKIDVEGFEYNVLGGLTQAIPLLSFEYTPERIQPAVDCIDRLTGLGQYEYNYSSEESMILGSSEWLRAEDMPRFVRDVIMLKGGSFGDIYARLV
jgi:FkbM family methyltransferase